MVKDLNKRGTRNGVIINCNTGSLTREEHGSGRQGNWTGNFLEAKQEDSEERNERNGKCEFTKGKLMYRRGICKNPKGYT